VSRFQVSCNKLRGKWIMESDRGLMSPAPNLKI